MIDPIPIERVKKECPTALIIASELSLEKSGINRNDKAFENPLNCVA
jgi:hypothetical protein